MQEGLGSEDVREAVRQHYAALATNLRRGGACCAGTGASCCGSSTAATQPLMFYAPQDLAESRIEGVPSFGCGNPIARADLAPGEDVLDLGSGAGLDVLIAARRVGPEGTVYGLDMTDEMLALAQDHKRRAGVHNAHFLRGQIESIPLPAKAVDVVISNCVINLSVDKEAALREAFRVLRPGGRLHVADMIEVEAMPDALRSSLNAWVGCIAGALPKDAYAELLERVGFEDIGFETIQVYRGADVGLDELPGAIASVLLSARRPKDKSGIVA